MKVNIQVQCAGVPDRKNRWFNVTELVRAFFLVTCRLSQTHGDDAVND